ncbi:ABC transporter ATP-binding protein [Halomarina litorea]|uniref:ABC transporter ATP-binding protein n=1 Tax=Halomarina litorea TaxID=2961595 RepID=UPI0020C4CF2E|nr:ABC transporter ATP-binding protein [Halomarina sp. BCD28]
MSTGTLGSGPPTIALTDVGVVYGRGALVRALDGVSLTIAPGSYTALMGPSGSGKSTLLHLAGCLDTPTSGRVELLGTDVAALGDGERATLRGREIGFVFQSFNLMPALTAVENVALPLLFQGVGRTERVGRATNLLEGVGLADRTDHLPRDLSGGQRQRVAIARALANDPALLLADEPTGSLDSATGDQIMALLDSLHADGTTIVLVTHDRGVAEHADRIVHLLDGRIRRDEMVDPQAVNAR